MVPDFGKASRQLHIKKSEPIFHRKDPVRIF